MSPRHPESIPHAASLLDPLRAARARQGRMLVALDFDGTLAPIVPRPEDARLDDAVRLALARLAARSDTDVAVISGRALKDLRQRVRVDGAYYAGNHGLEIEGPGVRRIHERAAAARPSLERLIERVDAPLRALPGIQIEDKGLTASIHYRRANGDAARLAMAIVEDAHAGDALIRFTHGKKVMELRPAVDWHKGTATTFLLETMERDSDAAFPAIFIGDDVTDEDAFRVLQDRRGGIIVADPPPGDTAATAYLRNVTDVAGFLDALARDDSS